VTDADLVRFLDAQSDVHDEVTKELTEGRKQTHWMWFVFPQLEGLGHSSMAQRYAIRDLDQARRYLAHPLLGCSSHVPISMWLGGAISRRTIRWH
jgi:uncharacterized protein (DUF1810 family)